MTPDPVTQLQVVGRRNVRLARRVRQLEGQIDQIRRTLDLMKETGSLNGSSLIRTYVQVVDIENALNRTDTPDPDEAA